MSLFEMLTKKRTPILEKCRTTMIEVMGLSPAQALDEGLSVMYDQLVEVVGNSVDEDSSETRHKFVSETISAGTSRKHARESHRQGSTISQLVRGYGSLCQGITEYALENKESISSAEFAQLNLCLDVAIAQAVTEFQRLSLGSIEKSEKLKMGFLVHELRNCLSSAILSHELVRMGKVGTDGATSRIITNALAQMRELVDQSVAGVRMSSNHELELTVFKIVDLLGEVESSLAIESNAKYLKVRTESDPNLEIEADRHLMVSAVTNLVQNAIKFTRLGGNIWIRAIAKGSDVVIEVEDSCGGFAEEACAELLKLTNQTGAESNGMGLGLAIVKRAADLNGCTLSVRNVPATGCIFSLQMPAFNGG